MDLRTRQIAENFFSVNETALVAFDRAGICVYANAAAGELLRRYMGRSAEPGTPLSQIVPPDDYPEFLNALGSSFAGNSPGRIVSIVHGADGGEVWFESSVTRVTTDDGDCAVLSIADITQRRTMLDQLSESERRFKSLVQNMAGIIVITDADGRISWISDSVHRFLGYHAHECRGRDIALFIHGKDISSFHVFLVNLRAVDNVTFSSEIQFKSRGGETLCFEIAGSSHLQNPTVDGIVLNMYDVTERRNLDQVTLRLARQNELILETAGEGIFGVNVRGLVSFINPFAASILGRRQEEIVGVHYGTVFTDNDGTGPNAELSGAIAAGAPRIDVETVFCRKDGTRIPVEFSASPIREGGAGAGSVVTFKDVSRRIQAEEELRRARDEAELASHSKSDFLAFMSHEIRTPMNSVLGFIEMLSLTNLDATQREYLSTASTNARHLLGLISDILDLSKIEKGKLELESEACVPSDEIAAAVSFFRAQAESRRISLLQDIVKTPECLGDALRLRQIIANLIGNAMKFTKEGGEVSVAVSVEKEDHHCRLSVSVSDTGIGMTRDQLAMIFNPFTQAEISIAKRFGGTGLGLSISARLVSLMGGTLHAESEPGKGSRFFFDVRLPLLRDAPAVEENRVLALPEGLTALVAEDTDDSRRLIVLMLQRLGVGCDTAHNGREAFEMSGRQTYDIIFLDGNMPVCDGFTAARMIRSREASLSLPRVPIVALSARAVTGDREKFLESGMDDYVTKPVSIDSLRGAIARNVSGDENAEGREKEIAGFIDVDRAAEALGIRREDYITLAWGFLSSLAPQCGELSAAIERGDLQTVRLVSHRIKGSAANFRFTRLSSLAADLEKTPESGLLVGGRVLASELRNEADRCAGEFRRCVIS